MLKTTIKGIASVALLFGVDEILKANVIIPKGKNKFINVAIKISAFIIAAAAVTTLTDKMEEDVDSAFKVADKVKAGIKKAKKKVKVDVDVTINKEENIDGVQPD